ncbi:MAG TPA: hypothetical protein VE076_12070 [Nitrososphaeraceae archaeon]|nr:hypothetical protein [Nitrososphaeraceae archaeon]
MAIINKCPKCSSGNMMQHPSSLSMPLSSSIQTKDKTKNVNIEDQDASFVFKFNSCKMCGYCEFYLINRGSRA